MAIGRRDIIEMLRSDIDRLKRQNQQLENRLARQHQAFRVMARLLDKIRAMSVEEDLPATLNELLADVMHACNIENGSLLLIDEDSGELEFVAVIGEAASYLMSRRIPLGTGLVGRVIESGEPLLVEDVRYTSGWSTAIDEMLDFHTQSLMCVAVTVHDQVVGAIEVVNHVDQPEFDENDLNVLRVAARLVSQVMECIEERMLQAGENND
jgi:transcriptional regulator with GAF, ATPase, and Fis domain